MAKALVRSQQKHDHPRRTYRLPNNGYIILLTCRTTPEGGYARRAGAQTSTIEASRPLRTIPLVVEDYGFPKTADENPTMTMPVMRGYPYKTSMCCKVPGKGRDPQVVAKIVRFIKETGLTHFAYQSDREPAITAMIDEAYALSG